MPFKSQRQRRTMQAAAHDLAFARKMGIERDAAEQMIAHDERARIKRAAKSTPRPRKK